MPHRLPRHRDLDEGNPMNDRTLQRLRTSRRYAWIGPGVAIAAMIALVVLGLMSQQPGLVVVATSVAASAAGTGIAVQASLSRRIATLEVAR
ncbi:MAG TPA: hypothetical protein PLK46_10250 [Propioniciclava sp.]|jgi:hypothetical protein|uniref:hypothetical protein n=1 Tax=Propioniciclava sp. TaxID=2038686 RepID=UPI002BFB9EA0|nr:hypothetical protein [Propioniciclava sp.]HRL80695.1 hypothetical protein [Propioniciclava sp.]